MAGFMAGFERSGSVRKEATSELLGWAVRVEAFAVEAAGRAAGAKDCVLAGRDFTSDGGSFFTAGAEVVFGPTGVAEASTGGPEDRPAGTGLAAAGWVWPAAGAIPILMFAADEALDAVVGTSWLNDVLVEEPVGSAPPCTSIRLAAFGPADPFAKLEEA